VVTKGRDHGRSTTATRQPLEGATGGNVGSLYLADGRGGTILNTDMLTWTFPHVSGVLPHPRVGMTLTALGEFSFYSVEAVPAPNAFTIWANIGSQRNGLAGRDAF
jgi:hypothetical protein